MITIVDYGLGNIRAFSNMFKRMNIEARTATCAAELESASKIILPGVGAFDRAMELLDRSGMRQSLDELVLKRKVPVLGICVGMQILAQDSDEGVRPGLGWIPGHVRAFKCQSALQGMPLPHMGWNDVTPAHPTRLFAGLEHGAQFYFLHSYFFQCMRNEDVVASAGYGIDFACAVQSANVYGVQCHPEKSHHWGGQLLKNFAEL